MIAYKKERKKLSKYFQTTVKGTKNIKKDKYFYC